MASDLKMLTTVDRLQQELKNTSAVLAATDQLTAIILEVSYNFARRCNRDFYYARYFTENVCAYASTNLQVSKHTPIDTSEPISVMFDSNVLDPNIYSVTDAELGIIFNKTGWYWTAPLLPNVQQDPFPGYENPLYIVSYSGGYVTPQQAEDNPDDDILGVRTLPYDIERAVIQWCVMLYRMQGANPLFESERLMSYSYKFTDTSKVPGGSGIPYVESVIAAYRRTGMST